MPKSLFIWTMRRTGGTSLAVILSKLSKLAGYRGVQHEPFNLNYAQIRRSHRRWSWGGSGSRINSVI